mgnify:CR=1 FL=1
MKELTIEKLVPLLTSPVWNKRLVGEYYELLIRCEGARHRIATLESRMVMMVNEIIIQKEIEMMQNQLYIMKEYEDILYRRLMHHGIPYVDILSEVLDASDVLDTTDEEV